MLENGITGITVAGFQVFSEPTYIPLSRLTLLFGPNSAGKSAVEDALRILSLMYSSPLFESFRESDESNRTKFHIGSITDATQKHWRRLGDSNDDYVETMQLSLHLNSQNDFDTALEQHIGMPFNSRTNVLKQQTTRTIELRTIFNLKRPSLVFDWSSAVNENFILLIDGEKLLEFNDGYVVINYSHQILSAYQIPLEITEAWKLISEYVSIKGKELVINSGGGSMSSNAHNLTRRWHNLRSGSEDELHNGQAAFRMSIPLINK